MGNLSITTLGEPQILHDAIPCTFATRKALALLLYLAVTAQPHPRTHLIALLWPEADAAHGSTNLRQALGRIRQGLGTDTDAHLLTPGDLVQLALGANGTIDLTQVSAAVPATARSIARLAALRCYRGSFCAPLTIDDAPDFMAWVLAQRAHWDTCYDVMVEHEMQICLANGQAEEAMTLGKAWVRLRPDIEVAYRLLATAQAAAGDVTGARLTLADCTQVWANLELALDPATVRLQEQMQTLSANAAAAPKAHAIRLPFVGRQGAFDQLRRAYEGARAGVPHLALIEGEAGVGKSRLLGAFTQWAALQRADVVLGRAYELSGRFPFQPLVALVRARLAREHAPDDLLDDPWLTELSRLAPDLRERYPDLPPPVDDAGAATRLVEALAQMGMALARDRPVVWVVEDLHWADEATRAALMALLGRWQAAGAAILLVVTLRAEERATSPALQGWVAAAERLAPVIPVMLTALTAADSQHATMKLLSDTASPALCDWLFAVTAGNPLYLEQVAQGLVERGVAIWQEEALQSIPDLDVAQLADWLPETLRELLLRRVRYLDATTQRVVAAAAVAGGRFTEDLVGAIAGVDEEALLTALEVAERRQLLHSEGSQYAFTHDKVAEAIYGDLTLARRRFFHRRALTALADHQTAIPADLFRHAKGAEAWEDVARYGQQAASVAWQIGAYRDAISVYEQVIQCLTSEEGDGFFSSPHYAPLYNALTELYLHVGEIEKARTLYLTMLTGARTHGNRSRENRLLTLLGMLVFRYDRNGSVAHDLGTQGRALAAQIGDASGQILADDLLIHIAIAQEDLVAAHAHAEEGVQLARTHRQTFRLAQCLNALGDIMKWSGQWEKAGIALEESVLTFALLAADNTKTLMPTSTLPTSLDWPEFLAAIAPLAQSLPTESSNRVREWGGDSLASLGSVRLHQGEGVIGRRAIEMAWTIMQERHAQFQQDEHLFNRTFSLLESGAYEQALQSAQHGIMALRSEQPPSLSSRYPMPYCALPDAYHACFRLNDIPSLLTEASALARDKPVWHRLLPTTRWCIYSAMMEDWETAYTVAVQAQELRGATPTQLNAFDLARYYETEALLRAGERERARADANELAVALGANRRYRLMWLRMQALLDHDVGDLAAAIAHLRQALTLAEAMGLPGEQWPIMGALADHLAAQGDAEGAQAASSQALAIIDGLAARITDAALRDHFAREARRRLPHG